MTGAEHKPRRVLYNFYPVLRKIMTTHLSRSVPGFPHPDNSLDSPDSKQNKSSAPFVMVPLWAVKHPFLARDVAKRGAYFDLCAMREWYNRRLGDGRVVRRGEVFFNRPMGCQRWGWTDGKVRQFLRGLAAEGMVSWDARRGGDTEGVILTIYMHPPEKSDLTFDRRTLNDIADLPHVVTDERKNDRRMTDERPTNDRRTLNDIADLPHVVTDERPTNDRRMTISIDLRSKIIDPNTNTDQGYYVVDNVAHAREEDAPLPLPPEQIPFDTLEQAVEVTRIAERAETLGNVISLAATIGARSSAKATAQVVRATATSEAPRVISSPANAIAVNATPVAAPKAQTPEEKAFEYRKFCRSIGVQAVEPRSLRTLKSIGADLCTIDDGQVKHTLTKTKAGLLKGYVWAAAQGLQAEYSRTLSLLSRVYGQFPAVELSSEALQAWHLATVDIPYHELMEAAIRLERRNCYGPPKVHDLVDELGKMAAPETWEEAWAAIDDIGPRYSRMRSKEFLDELKKTSPTAYEVMHNSGRLNLYFNMQLDQKPTVMAQLRRAFDEVIARKRDDATKTREQRRLEEERKADVINVEGVKKVKALVAGILGGAQ